MNNVSFGSADLLPIIQDQPFVQCRNALDQASIFDIVEETPDFADSHLQGLVAPFVTTPSTPSAPSSYVPTAYVGPFNFFEHFSAEVREKVYEHLVKGVTVQVDGFNRPSVTITKRSSMSIHKGAMGPIIRSLLAAGYRSAKRPTNFLTISRRLFSEVRTMVWRSMSVKFERRWDFVNAYINGTLHADSAFNFLDSVPTLTLFPRKSDVFLHISELHLNLSQNSDFDGKVFAAEASRVTKQMLQITKNNMPRLRTLQFTIDDRSRINCSGVIFVPETWFLDAVVQLTQVKSVELVPGPGLRGHSQYKRNAIHCLRAINSILSIHFKNKLPEHRLDYGRLSGKPMQARLCRRMMRLFSSDRRVSQETVNAVATKLAILQSGLAVW